MKQLFTVTFIFVCSLTFSQESTTNHFSWLIGEWARTNSQPGKITTEQWGKISNQELQGIGVTVKKSDTVFYEKMTLKTANKDLFFIVITPQNKDAVHFKITSFNKNSFECENQENDFPKKITYRKTSDGLKATISGDGKSIDFLFERIND